MSKVNVKAAVAALIALCLGTVGLFGAVVLVRGFVLTVLWGWFAVPVFGLPALGIIPALGLIVMLNYLLNRTHAVQTLSDIFASAGLALGVGWVIHLFM